MRKTTEAGFTLIELLIVVAVIGILAAVAVPGLLRARESGNEASAIGSLRVIASGQHAYMSSCGNGYYASSLLILANPAPIGAAFISPDLGTGATVDKSGYRLAMAQGSEAIAATQNGCNPMGLAADLFTSYYGTNSPLITGQSGSRWFWINTAGTIYTAPTSVFATITVGNTAPGVGAPLQ